MLNRDQVYQLCFFRKCPDNIFNEDQFPLDLLKQISYFHDPDADQLVQLIADGNKDAAKKLLDKNPRLVLQAANVVTPGGMTLKRIMPYECALIGDPDMALMVGDYFEKIELKDNSIKKEDFVNECKKLREEQFKRYEQAIDNMLNVKSYDFTSLINIIKKSSAQDVTAELDHTENHQSKLRTALEAFRKVFAPVELKKAPEQIEYIGFIDASLLQILKILSDEWNTLSNYGSNYDKCDLVWRQLIGFIERRLSAVERFALAQGVDDINGGAMLARSLKYKYDNKNEFPLTPIDNSHSGLGFDFAVSIYAMSCVGVLGGRTGRVWAEVLKNYFEQKQQDFQKLSSSCNIHLRRTK
ncbi:MAG: hypothetical protein A3F14_00575 [Gammaproteobacteria bacterium RIFCSPHIGHO2_12_FULL_43_28]|nr:MAG: hypothetical protein A3F14_00575 [Gammaproteobacteria bacterium RIFCSPHIGHO2_12_FULL_43_28]